MKSSGAVLLVLALAAAASGLMYLKVTQLGLPLVPGELAPVWVVEAKITFKGVGKPAVATFDIPDDFDGYLMLDEYFIGRGYGLSVETTKKDRRAEWSRRRASGEQRLYYRVEVVPTEESDQSTTKKARAPKAPAKPAYEEPLKFAIEDVLGDTRAESANIFTFVTQLLGRLNVANPEGNIAVVRGNIERGAEAWVERLIYVLAGARITARLVRGIQLTDGASNAELVAWLEVHNGDHWEGFDPLTGDRGYPENFLRWSVGSDPIVQIDGGSNLHTTFAISRYAQSPTRAARERAGGAESWVSHLLLFNLPVSTQHVFSVLLMVPLGALVVAFMRTIVGVPTLGTFMPILVALAFRETDLGWGLMLFTFIVGSGMLLRFVLARLQLLLVPRLCAMLVMVVLLMLMIGLLSGAAGFDIGFSIALFPIVILTMVIEHMAVVWEESGAGTALKEGFGSLVVAVAGYLVMNNDYLTHIVFLFPEVLLFALALFIVMGRYTGYRLNEIMRFRDIVDKPDSDVQPHS